MDDRLLSDLVSKGTPPDSYVLRKARTLDDILGEDNQFGLKSGSAMSADTVNIFNSATTKLAAYYSGNEWRRRGSTENIGSMPVFSHEPLTITRKAGSDVTAVVIGEVSLKNQKLVVPTFNSLLHTRLPLSQTLAEIALQLLMTPSSTFPQMTKCHGQGRQQQRFLETSGQWRGCFQYPLQRSFSIYYESSKTPSYITVSSKHQTNK